MGVTQHTGQEYKITTAYTTMYVHLFVHTYIACPHGTVEKPWALNDLKYDNICTTGREVTEFYRLNLTSVYCWSQKESRERLRDHTQPCIGRRTPARRLTWNSPVVNLKPWDQQRLRLIRFGTNTKQT